MSFIVLHRCFVSFRDGFWGCYDPQVTFSSFQARVLELRATPHGAAAALSLECLGYGELRDLENFVLWES